MLTTITQSTATQYSAKMTFRMGCFKQFMLRLGDFMKIAVFRFALSGGKSVLKVRKTWINFQGKRAVLLVTVPLVHKHKTLCWSLD